MMVQGRNDRVRDPDMAGDQGRFETRVGNELERRVNWFSYGLIGR